MQNSRSICEGLENHIGNLISCSGSIWEARKCPKSTSSEGQRALRKTQLGALGGPEAPPGGNFCWVFRRQKKPTFYLKISPWPGHPGFWTAQRSSQSAQGPSERGTIRRGYQSRHGSFYFDILMYTEKVPKSIRGQSFETAEAPVSNALILVSSAAWGPSKEPFGAPRKHVSGSHAPMGVVQVGRLHLKNVKEITPELPNYTFCRFWPTIPGLGDIKIY